MSQIAKEFVGEVEAKCPRCGRSCFEEVMTGVTVSSPFKIVDLDLPDGSMEPNFEHAENTGGAIDRYQCADCGHIVAKTTDEFLEWLKQNGTPCLKN